MNFFNEYGLLVAVTAPVAVVAALQVYLFAVGERGTLLLPSLKPYDSVPTEPVVVSDAEMPRTVCEEGAKADNPLERLAA
jgi:hypothetical protein